MQKDEFMGHVHASIGPVGNLTNPNATAGLKNALVSCFSVLYDVAASGGATPVAAAPPEVTKQDLKGLSDNLSAALKTLTALETRIDSLETKGATTSARKAPTKNS